MSMPPQDPEPASTGVACAGCGAILAPALLACPACQRLVHSERLKELARLAGAASDAGDALGHWRDALALLPAGSAQVAEIKKRMAALQAPGARANANARSEEHTSD